MISYQKKFYLFKVRETWFNYTFRLADLFRLKIYSHVKHPGKEKNFFIKNTSHTIELDMSPPEDVILSKFRNTVKQEIRKSEKEGVICTYEQDIDKFIKFHNDFAALKKIYPAKREMINSIGDNFKISFARLGDEILAAHSYIVDEEAGIVRLFHSASRRLDETIDRNVIGRANKLLTAKDIFYFKEKGFKIMDFGGFAENTEDKSLKGINEFKLSFGGEKVACINYHSPVYYILRKISEKLDRRY